MLRQSWFSATVSLALALLQHAALAGTEFFYLADDAESSRALLGESTVAHGRSDIECAMKCTLAGATCAAAALMPGQDLCLLFPPWNSSGVVAPTTSLPANRPAIFRKQQTDQPVAKIFVSEVYVTVLSRTFRVIQQRLWGNVSFARSWSEYETGFGDSTDFWLGLRTINELTGNAPKLLRVEAYAYNTALFVGEFSSFSVGDAASSYTMTYGSSVGGNMSSDSLATHKGMKFSTMDVDNDGLAGSSCSQNSGNAGWWFNQNLQANPNGIYQTSAQVGDANMLWKGAGSEALKGIRLMLQT